MVEAILAAAWQLTNLETIFFVVLGSLVGFLFGIIPGLGALQALVLVLPFTFGVDPMSAMFLYAGLMGSGAFAGSIPAILIRVPGTEVNIATIFDGYPMTQRGEAGRALGLSLASSGLGALFGLFVLVALLPVVRTVVLAFAPPEFFMLTLFGLAATIVVVRGNMVKGVVTACLGVALSLVGMQQTTGEIRYAFGTTTLWDGIPLIPFFIGLFAIGQVIKLSFEGTIIGQENVVIGGLREVFNGAKEIFNHKICFLRSAAIGTLIGIIPGIGGVPATFMSYIVAMQTSAKKELFGTGIPDGVIAAETANNSKDGGALLTTVSFGIPGSVAMAILLGAFLLHGLIPGPMLIRQHLDIVFALILGMVASTVIGSAVGLLLANRLAMVARINIAILIPVVVTVSLVGVYIIRENVFDIFIAIIFGFFSYGLEKYGFPIVTISIGFVLGKLLELAFHQSVEMALGNYMVFFTRPVSLTIFGIVILTLLLPFLSQLKKVLSRIKR